MSTKLYVGNLGFSTAEEQVRDAFAEFGRVVSVSVITDRATGQSAGLLSWNTTQQSRHNVPSIP
jgi:RNA recognition motif-containing protein